MYYIGIMSGTSLDGIDTVLVEDSDSNLILRESISCEFEDDLKKDLEDLLATFVTGLEKLGEIDARLGIAYAQSVNKLLAKANTPKEKVIAIGCHGQTVFHSPRGKYPFTMQIGDGNRVAELTGIKTVCDFRRMDVAFGGDGAPLAPAFHNGYLFSKEEPRVILNMGGIANITILNQDESKVLGFDTGPANCLMDLWIQKCKNIKYDKNGEWAKSGKTDIKLLNKLLSDDYFKLTPPKSTGKELFNLSYLEQILASSADIKHEDIQATLCDFTAETIANDIKRYAPECRAVYCCGGGGNNIYLLERLRFFLNDIKVSSTDELGVPSQWMEAIAFAWLAKRRIERKYGNIPSVTGAKEKVLLGTIYEF